MSVQNILKSRKKNNPRDSLVEKGLNIISNDTLTEVDLDTVSVKVKETALTLLMLGIVEDNAKRINKMRPVLTILENSLFDPEALVLLEPAEQIERYKLAMAVSKDSTVFIKEFMSKMNWEETETKFTLIKNAVDEEGKADEAGSEVFADARKMLKKISMEKKE